MRSCFACAIWLNDGRRPAEGFLQILDRDPARIHVLYDLTGGNPRTLAMLYLVLETSGDEDVMRDLERLLDQATPLYKARVEEWHLRRGWCSMP